MKSVLDQEFVGRSDEIILFRQLLDNQPKQRILVFYGIGGVGKSWLMRKLMTECAQSNTLHAHINLSQVRDIDYLYILTSLRNQLGADAFQQFDLIMEKYARQMRTVYLSSVHQIDKSPTVTVNVRDNVFAGSVGDIVGIKLENVDVSIPREELNRLRQEMQVQMTSAFLSELERLANTRIVTLFFDAYERIEDVESDYTTDTGEWLRRDVLKYCFVESNLPLITVLARRRSLTWELEDREWRQWLWQVELKPFSYVETAKYCLQRQIGHDDLMLQNALHQLTRGHPQCVSLACDLVNEVESQGGRITSTEFASYRGDFDEKLVSEFLMEAILRLLPRNIARAVRCCAIPHRFDADTIRKLLNIRSNSEQLLDRIAKYSFVYSEPDGGYAYHEVIRQLLLAKWRHDDPDEFRRIHEKALSMVTSRVTRSRSGQEQRSWLLEKLYHQAHVDEQAAVVLLRELFSGADKALDVAYCEKLIYTVNEIGFQPENQLWIDYYQARILFLKGEWLLAEKKFQVLLPCTKDVLELWSAIAADLGTLYQGQGNLDESIHWLRESLRVREHLEEATEIVRSLNELGTAYRTKIELEKALECYKRSYEIVQQEGTKGLEHEVAYSQLYSGVIYTGLGKYAEALESYQVALNIFQQLENKYGIARVYQRLGWIARIRGQFSEAILYHQDALRNMEQLDFPFPTAELLHSLGNVYREQSEWTSAKQYYEQALDKFQKLGATRHIGILINDLGTLFYDQGKQENDQELLATALAYYQESLAIKRRLNQARESSTTLYFIGEIYSSLGRWDEAEQYLLESLAVSQEIKVRINEARALTGLCELESARGNADGLRSYATMALTIAESDKYNHYAARVHSVLGDYHLDTGNNAAAAKSYARSLYFARMYNWSRYQSVREHVVTKSRDVLLDTEKVGIFFKDIQANLSEVDVDVVIEEMLKDLLHT